MRRTFRTVNPLLNLEPSCNVAPPQLAPVVRRHPETGERHLDLLQWGLLPYFTKDPVHARRPINAHTESAAKSGMFPRAFELRRAIAPADAFYELKVVANGKQPYAIARQDREPMAFAGLWKASAGRTAP
jgi:putative SOS response-associated peptidase YedK